mmetsp:Transcript_5229/g.14101  ORF Transcript_5229/g.14101 Transcript_5229/m.14101 type:complete len:309 (-) Transcript_5229:839-1765(-)
MVQQRVADAGCGLGACSWLGLQVVFLLFAVLGAFDTVEGVCQDCKREVVESGDVLLLLGMGGIDKLVSLADTSELDEGQDGLADFPEGCVVEDEGSLLLLLVELGASEQHHVACEEGGVEAGLVGIGEQAKTLQPQSASIHAVLHEQAVRDLERDDGVLLFGCRILLLHGEHPLDLVGVHKVEVDAVRCHVLLGIKLANSSIQDEPAVTMESNGVALSALELHNGALLPAVGAGVPQRQMHLDALRCLQLCRRRLVVVVRMHTQNAIGLRESGCGAGDIVLHQSAGSLQRVKRWHWTNFLRVPVALGG